MTKTLDPSLRVGGVVFELDRFEREGDDSFAVQGRWFGVRGRRFIRPTLTVFADGRPVRLLADLAHKPWAAQDGESWEAAFPCGRVQGAIREAELAVSPDLSFTLSAPGVQARVAEPSPQAVEAGPRTKAPPSEEARDRRRQSELSRELAEAQESERALRRQLERSADQRTAEAARMDQALGNLSRAMQERDEALAARDEAVAASLALGEERERLRAERDQARATQETTSAERNELTTQRDAARRTRDEAVRARDEALASRDAAVQAHDERGAALAAHAQTQTEREEALSTLSQLQAEYDAALLARDEALAGQQSLRATVERLQSELAHHASTQGAALVMRRAVQEPPFFRSHPPLISRALAIIGLLAVVVVLMIVLHVV